MDKNKCTSCGEAPKKCSCKNKEFTKAVVEINNPDEVITLMRKVVIPASMGDDKAVPPEIGKYKNVLLYYEANSKSYLYSSDGIPTLLANGLTDYEQAVNLPEINGHTLLGNQSGPELGLQNEISNIEQYARLFDTVADMKASTDLADGDYAKTLGYYNINDNGGAIYKISSTQPSTYYETLTSGLYAAIITYSKVYPEMFGAYGDGTHDDAPSIRTAMSYVSSHDGGTIEFSDKKVYLLNSLSNPGSTITTFFEVPDNTTLCGKGTLKIADNFGDYDNVFRPTSALNRLEFRDFTLDDNTTGNPILDTTGGSGGHHRTGFRLIAQPTEQIIMDGITFNDCAGVWQVIIERVINAELSNITINYNDADTHTYDSTSIYFGALHGSVHGCKLYGKGKSRTAIELHGIDNAVYDTYIEGYRSGIYLTNANVPEENVYRQEAYSNTILTRKTGVKYWMIVDGVAARLLSVHDNLIVVDGENEPTPIGVGLHPQIGNGATVEDFMVNNNTITIKHNSEQKSIPLSFGYSSSTNSSTIKNLNIRNNMISGEVQYAIEIQSQADDTLKILNTTVDGNEFNVSNATTLFHFVAHSGFNYVFFTNNIIRSDSIERLYGIFGSPDCQTFISGNNCDKRLVAYYVTGNSVDGVKIEHDNVYLDTSILFNALPPSVADGSVFKSDKYTCVKSDGKWTVNCSSDVMPTHRWFGKGSVINLTNGSDIMAIAKKDGYVADHDMSTGDHKLGEWVKYGLYVWYCKEDNTYTDDPSTHPDEFQYIGESCTFYTISST